jgi:MscS family membrane protein
LIGAVLNRVSDVIIDLSKLVHDDIDSQIVRLGFQVTTLIIICAIAVHLGARLGLPTYSLVAGLGVGGIAVALAGKEALANLIGGIIILLDRPFKVGHVILLGHEEHGVVVEIGLRSTRIRTRDDVLISIPNSTIVSSKVTNQSAPIDELRIKVDVGVAYGSDVEEVDEALLHTAENTDLVVSVPAPSVRFRRFGASALEFQLLCWIKDPETRGKVIDKLNRGIYDELAKRGVKIPFPQRDIHIRTAGAGEVGAKS